VRALSPEVHRIRSVLETVLTPDVATAVMFAALSRYGNDVPVSHDDVAAFVRGALSEELERRYGGERLELLSAKLENVLGVSTADALQDIDIDMDEDPSVTMPVRVAFKQPVGVLVIAGDSAFADRLVASLGSARVYATAVHDVAELRRTTFSKMPLLVYVDASAPPAEDAATLARAVRDMPANVTVVIWGSDLSYGRELDRALEGTDAEPVRVRGEDGFAPMLDLILARYEDSIPPPSAT
jgi:hypothetical protein